MRKSGCISPCLGNSARLRAGPLSAPAGKDHVDRVHASLALGESGQELRVAELILRGYSYTKIARTLKIKPSTVKTHRLNIYTKLQIHSKRELFLPVEKMTVTY